MLRYSEFCEAFLPVDNFHASLLAKKAPILGGPSVNFSPATMEHYKEVWMMHLKHESQVEGLRAEGGFVMQQAFETIDQNKDGYIDRDDVSFTLS